MLRPETEEELAEIVRGANAPLAVCGGGTRHRPGDGEALKTRMPFWRARRMASWLCSQDVWTT